MRLHKPRVRFGDNTDDIQVVLEEPWSEQPKWFARHQVEPMSAVDQLGGLA